MFLGVVSNPIPSKNFDGKISLTRVSKTEVYKQRTHNQNFSEHAAHARAARTISSVGACSLDEFVYGPRYQTTGYKIYIKKFDVL